MFAILVSTESRPQGQHGDFFRRRGVRGVSATLEVSAIGKQNLSNTCFGV